MFIALKPLGQRKHQRRPGDRRGCTRRPPTSPGATLYLQAVQDLRIGGRSSNAHYQYTLQGSDLQDLIEWAPQLLQEDAQHADH